MHRYKFLSSPLLVGGFAILVFVGGFLAVSLWSHGALAAPVVGSGGINLQHVNDTQTIYTHTPSELVGITVRVDSGSLQVESQTGGNWSSLGTVSAGQAHTFEGDYTQVMVKALVGATIGFYSNRRPTDAPGEGHYVGSGWTTVTSASTRIYAGPSQTRRNVMIKVLVGSISLRTSSGGVDLVTIDAGDSVYHNAVHQEYWLAGSGTASFYIYDALIAPAGPKAEKMDFTGNAADDDDTAYVSDGGVCVKIVIKNTSSSGNIAVFYEYASGIEDEVGIEPGESLTITCFLIEVVIKFPKKGRTATVTVETLTTI